MLHKTDCVHMHCERAKMREREGERESVMEMETEARSEGKTSIVREHIG